MGEVGCYTCHFSCDHGWHGENWWRDFSESNPLEVAGRSRADCARQARRRGWHIGHKWHYCPDHLPGQDQHEDGGSDAADHR